jgi:ABC-type amino acid transport substrate-binding protein
MNKLLFKFSSAIFMLACLCISCSAQADDEYAKIKQSGLLKVAVYNDFAPFSDNNKGIDIDLANALAKKLGFKLQLLPFQAGESLGDDLRNMVWKGHYLGYGPADVMLHVPVDQILRVQNDKVEIFAPYHRELVRLVRDIRKVPIFDNLDSMEGKNIGVEKVSLAAVVLLGAEDGKFREKVKIFDSATQALEKLKAGELDGVLATKSEIESVIGKDPNFQISEVHFERLPPKGWVIGMSVKKSDPELVKAVQDATNELITSGEMAKIFSNFGVELVTP